MKNNTSVARLQDLLDNESFVQWATGKTARDSIFWEQWQRNSPDKQELLDDAVAVVRGLKFSVEDINTQEIERALTKLNDKIDHSSMVHNSVHSRFRRRWLMGIAATIVFFVACAGWYWYSEYYSKVTIRTAFGEWKTVELPDGSVVNLNADSELRFERKWEDKEVREVWLHGEAFFQVVKMLDLDTDFRVITDDLDVEVLGTSFNVKSRGEQTEVYLEEGKVKLGLGDQITYLDPGDMVSYSARQDKVVDRRRTDGSSALPSAWNHGVIDLQKAYAFDIFNKLEEIYGVNIRVRNEEIYTKEYRVQLPMKELGIVVPILEKSMKVEITRRGDTLLVE